MCLLDFDFQKGDVRTHLGIENPVPNLQMWIEDIVDKLSKGIPYEKIRYNRMQVLS